MKKSFCGQMKWYETGCETDDDFQSLINAVNWDNRYEENIISNTNEFVCYYEKKDGQVINSFVDLIGKEYYSPYDICIPPTYFVEGFDEINKNLIDMNLFDEKYLNEYTQNFTREEKLKLLSKIEKIQKGIASIIARRKFVLKFKNNVDKINFLKILGSDVHLYTYYKHDKEDNYLSIHCGSYKGETYDSFSVGEYRLEDLLNEGWYFSSCYLSGIRADVKARYRKDDNKVNIYTKAA